MVLNVLRDNKNGRRRDQICISDRLFTRASVGTSSTINVRIQPENTNATVSNVNAASSGLSATTYILT